MLTVTNLEHGLGTPIAWDAPRDLDIIYRQSTRESLALCGGRVLQHQDRPPSEAMAFGTLVHSLIEYRMKGTVSAMLHLPAWVERHWAELLASEGYDLDALASKGTITASVREAIDALKKWEAFFWDGHGEYLDVLGIEELRVVPLGMLPDGRAAWLQGTPDLVTAPSIEDFKTSGTEKKWSKGMHLNKAQAPLYAYLEQQAGTIELPIPFNFQVYGRDKGTWVSYPLVVTQEMVDGILTMAWVDVEAIAAGALPYNPYGESYGTSRRGWWCQAKYCNAWEVCAVKYAIHDGKAEETFDPHWG